MNVSSEHRYGKELKFHEMIEFTVEEVVEEVGFGKFQILLLFVAGFSWMADAMEMMILAILGPVSRCEWFLKAWEEALLSTVVFVGMFVSSALWGKMCDLYGRKSGIVLSSAWIMYFGVLSSFSPSYNWILFLRFLVGCGVSGIGQVVVLYAEFVPAGYRAVTILSLGGFWAIGGILEVVLAIVLIPSLGWRWLLAVSSLPLVIFLILSMSLPESPRFHVGVGEISKGYKTLQSLAQCNGKELPKNGYCLKTNTMKDRGRVADLFRNSYWKTTILVWIQMFGGLLIYYGVLLMTPTIFQYSRTRNCDEVVFFNDHNTSNLIGCGCKSLEKEDYFALLLTSFADIPGLLIVMLFIDRIGRIKTLVIGFGATSLLFGLLTLCNGETMTTIYIFGVRYFATGVTQALYIYIPEVYSTNIRGLGLGSASAVARIGCILTPFLAQVLIKRSLRLTLLVYSGCAFVCCMAAALLPIETSGKGMKETSYASE
ncbi:synaptic vesicle 2-related protein-like [Xenia sp. Carnegie-2017]|uniref:synaptic vesicle 2-related protein-like n=1 Tax=Xenia sp. Carnegie-2017 TaxID=2897299 RepID=UPI001F04D362|nr:synaptic vesicle 2-related protein-like [Xenia sp. Carnegie-2017]XP_046839415.1 synaptic vesicle 2-related protein-like [Xenia sp. Carnegie-2017]